MCNPGGSSATKKVPIKALRVNEFPYKFGQLTASSHSAGAEGMNIASHPFAERFFSHPGHSRVAGAAAADYVPVNLTKRGAARMRGASQARSLRSIIQVRKILLLSWPYFME